jgi:hypothetical protein
MTRTKAVRMVSGVMTDGSPGKDVDHIRFVNPGLCRVLKNSVIDKSIEDDQPCAARYHANKPKTRRQNVAMKTKIATSCFLFFGFTGPGMIGGVLSLDSSILAIGSAIYFLFQYFNYTSTLLI